MFLNSLGPSLRPPLSSDSPLCTGHLAALEGAQCGHNSSFPSNTKGPPLRNSKKEDASVGTWGLRKGMMIRPLQSLAGREKWVPKEEGRMTDWSAQSWEEMKPGMPNHLVQLGTLRLSDSGGAGLTPRNLTSASISKLPLDHGVLAKQSPPRGGMRQIKAPTPNFFLQQEGWQEMNGIFSLSWGKGHLRYSSEFLGSEASRRWGPIV